MKRSCITITLCLYALMHGGALRGGEYDEYESDYAQEEVKSPGPSAKGGGGRQDAIAQMRARQQQRQGAVKQLQQKNAQQQASAASAGAKKTGLPPAGARQALAQQQHQRQGAVQQLQRNRQQQQAAITQARGQLQQPAPEQPSRPRPTQGQKLVPRPYTITWGGGTPRPGCGYGGVCSKTPVRPSAVDEEPAYESSYAESSYSAESEPAYESSYAPEESPEVLPESYESESYESSEPAASEEAPTEYLPSESESADVPADVAVSQEE